MIQVLQDYDLDSQLREKIDTSTLSDERDIRELTTRDTIRYLAYYEKKIIRDMIVDISNDLKAIEKGCGNPDKIDLIRTCATKFATLCSIKQRCIEEDDDYNGSVVDFDILMLLTLCLSRVINMPRIRILNELIDKYCD